MVLVMGVISYMDWIPLESVYISNGGNSQMTQITIEVTEEEMDEKLGTLTVFGQIYDKALKAYKAKKKEEAARIERYENTSTTLKPLKRLNITTETDYKTKYLELTEKFLKMAENYNKLASLKNGVEGY